MAARPFSARSGASASSRRPLRSSPFAVPDAPAARPSDYFAVGDRVSHDRMGLGRVLSVDDEYVCVDFGVGVVKAFPISNRSLDTI
jgi:hypothetical protein